MGRRSFDTRDYERIARTLRTLYNPKTEEEFLFAYRNYFENVDSMQDNEKVQKEVFRILAEKSDNALFKRAKGKSLSRDRSTTAKTVVKTRKEYIKRGAANVDLKGFDTKSSKDRLKRLRDRLRQYRKRKKKRTREE